MHYPILLETELANRWRLSVKTPAHLAATECRTSLVHAGAPR